MKERARSQRNQELKRQMESEPEPEAITDVQFETRPSGPAGKGPMIFFETRTEATTALLNAVAKDVLEGQSNYVFHQVGTGNTPGRHGWELGNSVKDQLPELVDEIKRQAEGILELAA